MKIFLLLVLISPVLLKKIPDAVFEVWGNLISPSLEECVESSKVDIVEIENMLKDIYVPNNKNFHDYIRCIYEKLGMLKPDGTFSEEVILRKATYLTVDLTRKCLKKTENEKNLSKKSYILCDCVVDGLAVD